MDAACELPCAESPQWAVAPDGTADWDELRAIAAELAAAKDTCEKRRAACVSCIRIAREKNVLR